MKETELFNNSILVLTELMAESFYAQEHNFCHGHLFLIEIDRITEVLGLQRTVVFEAMQKLREIRVIEYWNTYIGDTILMRVDWQQIITFAGVPLKKEVHPQWDEGLDDVQDCNFKCVFFEESTRKFMADLEKYYPDTQYNIPFVTFALCNKYIKEYETGCRSFYDDNPIPEMLEARLEHYGYITQKGIEDFVFDICFCKEEEIF